MVFDKDALEFLAQQAVGANGLEVVHPDGEPAHIYFLNGRDGPTMYVASPLPRHHTVQDINALVASLQLGDPESDISIWYSRDAVTAVLDDAERRNTVYLPVSLSPQIVALQSLQDSPRPFSQRELIQFLRVKMWNCLGVAGDLLSCVRSIKFTSDASGESTHQATKRSVGNKIEQNISGAGSLPEYVDFQVPLFANPNLPYIGRVTVALDVDPATQHFSLVPVPLSIQRCLMEGEDQIGKDVREAVDAVDSKTEDSGNAEVDNRKITVLYGKP